MKIVLPTWAGVETVQYFKDRGIPFPEGVVVRDPAKGATPAHLTWDAERIDFLLDVVACRVPDPLELVVICELFGWVVGQAEE